MVQILNTKTLDGGGACCDGWTGMNWRIAGERKDDDMAAVAARLSRREKLKLGWRYECLRCATHWFLDEEESWIARVPHDRRDAVLEWSRRDLSVDENSMSVLRSIGATPPDLYGNGSDAVVVPCQIVLASGASHERALFCFQRRPPLTVDAFAFADDVVEVAPSDFALSPTVRVATTRAAEVSMGYAPTGVRTSHGDQFVLNWTTHFVSYGSLRGADITLDHAAKATGRILPESAGVVRVIADWSEQSPGLRLPPQ